MKKMKMMAAREFEEQLVDFVVVILGVTEALPDSKAGNHVAGLRGQHKNAPMADEDS